jgi:hypothetical protein
MSKIRNTPHALPLPSSPTGRINTTSILLMGYSGG